MTVDGRGLTGVTGDRFNGTGATFTVVSTVFWRNIDPLTVNGRFHDVGSQYWSEIVVHEGTQRRVAEESKRAVAERLGGRL